MSNSLNSLGIAKSPGSTRVVAAMSGGVDSSVVAGLLKRDGYDVIGVTLQLYDHGAAIKKKRACCAGQDIHDARRVAEKLDIPHYVLDYEERFRKAVMEDFAEAYVRGETPIPCVRCNERVKFGDLLQLANELGADALATGHYVRRMTGQDGPELHAAIDTARDQSYFLFATTSEQLQMLHFPLGALEKSEVRVMAKELGLSVAAKPDSQDICFVPEGHYADIVERLRPGAAEPGEIVDLSGRILGTHPGIIHFTVGQRKGLGLSGNADPLFVVELDAPSKRLIVGPRDALCVRSITLSNVNWLTPFEGDCRVKIRSTREPIPAFVRTLEGGAAMVELPTGEEGVSLGQACVFYAEDSSRVLGGGWIVKTDIAKMDSAKVQLAPSAAA
jgi:tRNA-specific 2-thiouridylase